MQKGSPQAPGEQLTAWKRSEWDSEVCWSRDTSPLPPGGELEEQYRVSVRKTNRDLANAGNQTSARKTTDHRPEGLPHAAWLKELREWPLLSLKVFSIAAVYMLLSCHVAEWGQAVPQTVPRGNYPTFTPLNSLLQTPKLSNLPKEIQPVSLLVGFTQMYN